MFPLFTTRFLHFRQDVRGPSGRSGNCGRECCPVILPKWRLPRHLGIFYMPQIYGIGPTALLPLRRKACWGFFSPLKIRRLRPGLNPRKASTLPLDHRSRSIDSYRNIKLCPLFVVINSDLKILLSKETWKWNKIKEIITKKWINIPLTK